MFKKLYKKFDTLYEFIKNNLHAQSEARYDTMSAIRKESDSIRSKLDNMSKTILSQQRTIEQLTNALKDKYEHGLFVFSEDCKTPMVIRNGEEVINKYTKWFRIEWAIGEAPCIETEQLVESFSVECDGQ